MRKPDAGGGLPAIRYSLRMGRRVGFLRLFDAMRRKNACKTCALGMGGQMGGMRNELGRFPELCKKSLQAMVADMQGELRDDFYKTYSLGQLKTLSPRELETAGRLVKPLYAERGATHLKPIGWDEAMKLLAERLAAARPEETFFYFSGRSSNEAGFLLQLFARLYGTNNVNNCSYFCHQASGAGLAGSVGVGTATVRAADLEQADLFVLIGGNPASNHPRLMTHLMHLKRRGGKVVVVNPVKETGLVRFRVPSDIRSLLFGTDIADEYVQPLIGGDIAFLMGLAKHVLVNGAVDRSFVEEATEGFEALRTLVDGTSWDELERASGVDRQTMEKIGDLYAQSQRTIFAWTMGITHHLHGVENVQWIANLALLRGMIGKEGAGLLPIRGHSNVQGMGTVGVTPTLKPEIETRWREEGLPLPETPGLDTMGCLDAARAGKMRVGIALGGNLLGSSPDAKATAEALARAGLMVYLNTSLNTGHVQGRGEETLILPVLARDEEPYKSTQESMFSFVRLSDGGPRRYEGPRAEIDIIAELGTRVLGGKGPIDFERMRDASHVREWIARLVPGLEALKEIEPAGKEFEIPGRILRQPRFPTTTGRARFQAHPVPDTRFDATKYLKLMSVRSEGQFNTVVYEDEDLYRGQERRDVILMNPKDLERLGLVPDQLVTVKSGVGAMTRVLARPFDIKEGCALMYYPECNVLIDSAVDPVSKTPAFKATLITVEALPGGIVAAGQGAGKRVASGGGLVRAFKRALRPKLSSC